MSVMDALKKDIGGKNKKQAAPAGELVLAGSPAPAERPLPAAEKVAKGQMAVLGGSPRANLLPPELLANHRKRAVRAGLRIIIVVMVVLVGLSVAGAMYLASAAQASLQASQQEAVRLAAELQSYADVQAAQQEIAEGEAARVVAGSVDVDWQAYIANLQTTLPGDVVLTDIQIDSATVTKEYVQSDVPLERERIATLTFTAETSVLPSIPDWIDRLSTMPGFADATPGSVELLDFGGYKATVTMHINTDAYSGRFAANEEDGE